MDPSTRLSYVATGVGTMWQNNINPILKKVVEAY